VTGGSGGAIVFSLPQRAPVTFQLLLFYARSVSREFSIINAKTWPNCSAPAFSSGRCRFGFFGGAQQQHTHNLVLRPQRIRYTRACTFEHAISAECSG